jgi:hypothetical protein
MARTNRPSELSARRLLVDSAQASALFGALVLGSLAYEPMIWYSDYPAAMKEKAGPQTPRGKRLAYLVVGPLLLLMVGSLVVSNRRLARQRGALSFGAALANAYSLFTLVNLFDTVVLDYWLLTKVQPRFAFLPGSEDMNMADYAPPATHALNFLKGCGFGALAALPVAFFTARPGRPRC